MTFHIIGLQAVKTLFYAFIQFTRELYLKAIKLCCTNNKAVEMSKKVSMFKAHRIFNER